MLTKQGDDRLLSVLERIAAALERQTPISLVMDGERSPELDIPPSTEDMLEGIQQEVSNAYRG